ncbi:MAG: SAM-dependent methyltransferase [Paludibacteraceae bacterium]|nr:SAM-dependent methyltransferase [Paludibacteraceae bacterium]
MGLHSNISIEQLALQRNRYRHLSDDEWRWFLQQVEGRERTADKLPTFAAIDDWWYPVRLSCEQCSSELTARYKAQIVLGTWSNGTCLDLTGGYGVDTFFLSEHFAHTDYVEQNAELCRIAAHNFALSQKSKVERQKLSIAVHNTTAEDFLSTLPLGEGRGEVLYSLIFLDPARRDSHGGKVFKLADCTPNVVELLPALLDRLAPNGRIMLKLSPMLDITQALKELQAPPTWDVHVVAVKNEVKEVLLLSKCLNAPINDQMIKCLDLSRPEQAFTFTREEEKEALCPPLEGELEGGCYLFEPNAAILKAGAYKLIAQRFGLHKLDTNTHLYVSDTLVENFPGRVWRIKDHMVNAKMVNGQMANVLCRNYPLTAEQLKKKLRLHNGGTAFVIGCRVAGKPTLFLAERL